MPFLVPLKPTVPALAHEMALPWLSVIVTIVLLNVLLMCATPWTMFFLSGLYAAAWSVSLVPYAGIMF